MSDKPSAAEIMFGATMPKQAASTTEQKADKQSAAEIMFGATAPREQQPASNSGVSEQVEGTGADALYGELPFNDVHLIPEDAPMLEGLDDSQLEQLNDLSSNWRDTLKHGNFGTTAAAELTSLVQANFGKPVDEVQQTKWRADADAYLQSLGNDAGLKLALAKELVNSDPLLNRAIVESKLQDHPKLLRLLVEHAWSLRASGRW
jgi:hypothetical protein